MIAKCPNCKFEYEVESNGKYLCGVCEKKFFFFKDGTTELATAPDADLPAAGGAISSRQFHTGDMILGHYRVIKMIATGTSDVIYRCFDENSCEHVMLKDLFPDIAIADESTARFQKVTELPAPAPVAPAAPAAQPVMPAAPAAQPVMPAAPVVPVAAPAAIPAAIPAAAPVAAPAAIPAAQPVMPAKPVVPVAAPVVVPLDKNN